MLRSLRHILLSLLFLLSSVFGAEVGDTILNSAFISYSIGGYEKNATTNEVNTTVIATDANISFLAYVEKGNSVTLEPTYYLGTDGIWHEMPPAELPSGSVVETDTDIYVKRTESYYAQDLVIIQVVDLDQNRHYDLKDTIEVNVTNTRTGEIERIKLQETELNSGVFVGYVMTCPSPDEVVVQKLQKTAQPLSDGLLCVKEGDNLVATYSDNGEKKNVTSEAEIVGLYFLLRTEKSQSKDSASIGEFVEYFVTVENISDVKINDTLMEDQLPDGFKYQSGSMRVDDEKVEPQWSEDGKILRYSIGTLMPHEKKLFRYVVLIGAGGNGKEAINQAWASAPLAGKSNVAKTVLKLKEELSRSKGFIVGRVSDVNLPCDATDPQKEYNATVAKSKVASIDPEKEHEKGCGISGVKIYMEDGRYVVTDKEGRFHLVDVVNGTHVLQLDESTFKGRYRLSSCQNNTRFAESNRSQFVTLYHGELVRADFCLEREPDVTGSATLHIAIEKQNHDEIVLRLHVEKDLDLINPEVYLKLPDGLHYIKGSISNHIEPVQKGNIMAVSLEGASTVTLRFKNKPYGGVVKEIEGIFYFDTAVSQDEHSEMASVAFSSPDENLSNIASIVKPQTEVKVVSVGGKLKPEEGDYNWTKATHRVSMPQFTPEQIDTMGDEPKIVWPPKGWVPDIPSTHIAVLYPRGAKVTLTLNGKKVNQLNYDSIFRGKSRKMYIMHYKGVDLYEGKNVIEAVVKKKNKVLGTSRRTIYVVSHLPEQITFLPQYSYLVADGMHEPVIAVRMTDAQGHPLRSGLVGSFTTNSDYKPKVMSNDRGKYQIDSEGIAYIRLEPTTKVGDVVLHFALYNKKQKALLVRLKPHMRDWILVGFAEGTVGYNTLKGHEEALDRAGADERWYKKGRVAFFAKGRVKGKWLLTMAYDSGRGKDDRELFDKIDADAYYTLFNDATTQDNEAPSRKKLYVKLEKDDFSVLFGDFNTGLTKTDLSSYSRSFTGIKSEYRLKELEAVLFGAETDQLFFRDELRGDGTRGDYQLTHTPLVYGSEYVSIEVRDRYHPERVLSRRALQRDYDYSIDYDDGTIYLKEPLYSADSAFNPQYLVVKYEVEGDGQNHYTYGGRVSYKEKNETYEVGATYVKEEKGNGSNQLYGVDAKVKVSEKITLNAEYAHTRNSSDGNVTTGDATKIELTYHDDNRSARVYYRKQDSSFGLGQLSDSLSATRQMGIDGEITLSRRWRLASSIYQNRSNDEDGHTDDNVAELRLLREEGEWKIESGYRYAKHTGSEATHQVTGRVEREMMDGNLSFWLSHDQSLSSNENENFPTRTAIGVNYRYDANTTLFAQIERSDTSDDIEWRARSGIRYEPWSNGTITITRLYDNDESGIDVYDTVGVDRTLTFAEVWKWRVGYEKGIAWDENNSDKNFDAFNSDLTYTSDRYSGEFSVGYRTSDTQERFNLDAGIYIKQSREIGLALATGYHRTWGGGEEKRDIDVRGSFVYRPLDGKWVVLDRLDLIETYRRGLTDEYKTQKVVNNMHLNWQYNPWWYFGLHYGLKHVIDTIDDEEYSSWTDLIGVNVRYDIKENWSVGLQGSLLHAYTANNLDFSGGVFVSMTPWQNAELTLEYNFAGFRDDDFNLQNYYIQGPYLRMRMKFDQESVKSMAKGLSNE